MTGDWDFKPSVERLIALHAGDDHDPGPPIAPAIGDAVGDELEAPAYAQSVLPAEIAAQREKGWPDFHPETFCHRCGRRNINWWTTAEAWEAATANLPRKELEILCPQCFADLWEQETGERSAWQVRRG